MTSADSSTLLGRDPARPIDPWRVIDTARPSAHDDVCSTLFAVSNGHIGIRDRSDEPGFDPTAGVFVNGVHETWPIRYPENAHALARTGQTLVPVHDCHATSIEVDGSTISSLDDRAFAHHREIDLRRGVATRRRRHRSESGAVVEVTIERLASLVDRHTAAIRTTVTLIEGEATVGLVATCRVPTSESDDRRDTSDPRRGRRFDAPVLLPEVRRLGLVHGDPRVVVTMVDRCRSSGVLAGCSAVISAERRGAHGPAHPLDLAAPTDTALRDDEVSRHRCAATLRAGESIVLDRVVAYDVASAAGGHGLPDELAAAVERVARSADGVGFEGLARDQESWLAGFHAVADIDVVGSPEIQQAVRWHLFQLAQAAAGVAGGGIPAKGLTADGYDGHYFWDTEVYLVPFLARTLPDSSRRLIEFRHGQLQAARRRAAEMSQRGALFPWRTINGEEASAYYPAGTAQYHIDAAVIHALDRHLAATGDRSLLNGIGAELLVETARLWADLGFHGSDGRFHINRVTGPDEYSAVVDDNAYTNIMARFNLAWAADVVDELRSTSPDDHAHLVGATGLLATEPDEWRVAAAAMAIPYDTELGIHEQDDGFLDLAPWDFAGTPAEKYPLLLNFHPLVIYRHQVLKQADVVLAMLLRDHEFDVEQRRRNFDFYDPLTTGDSSLSACVQAAVAAQVGRIGSAVRYLGQALALDLADTHRNTIDGVHIANCGGVWAALVNGFAGIRFRGHVLAIEPSPPEPGTSLPWDGLTVRFLHRGNRCEMTVSGGHWRLWNHGEDPIEVEVDGQGHLVAPGSWLGDDD
jgi:alpha,alpha-trehalose phosphorylase